jgi:hypothetical protein
MERLIYWVLFVAGLVLAGWLPAKSVFSNPAVPAATAVPPPAIPAGHNKGRT